MQKKLTLKKETLKNLSPDLLRQVVSGQLAPALDPLAAAAGSIDSCNVF